MLMSFLVFVTSLLIVRLLSARCEQIHVVGCCRSVMVQWCNIVVRSGAALDETFSAYQRNTTYSS